MDFNTCIFGLLKDRYEIYLGYTVVINIETRERFESLSLQGLFSSTGRRPASLCHGVHRASVRLSVRALTFNSNIFFSETANPIFMKFQRNVPAMVLFRIS